jgi:DNA polymerase
MRIARLDSETDFDGWRRHARNLLCERVRPEDITWQVGAAQDSLFALLDAPATIPDHTLKPRVPKQFLADAKLALCHRDEERFGLLYRLLYRMQDRADLLSNAVDDDVMRLNALVKSVSRDRHKMRAFVRFRAVKDENETYIAWFEPEHRIVEENAPFFVRRFTNMTWSILTPECSAHWDRKALRFGPGAAREDAPDADALEDLWRTYFAAIFNPARLKVKAMTSEMPKKYWKNLPEAELIAPMIAEAQKTTAGMIEAAPTTPKRLADYAFSGPDTAPGDVLAEMRGKAAKCDLCDHACHATQTVFGEGPLDAALMVVGEQPGDLEDIAGRPFVGPAGQLFDEALAEVGLSREALYVTNAVKHFRFTPKGKKRIHRSPKIGHIDHCRWWLKAERQLIKPRVTLAMGATAIRALAGKTIPVGVARETGFDCFDGRPGIATVHPAAILRQSGAAEADALRASLITDLRRAKEWAEGPGLLEPHAPTSLV